ncbi:CvfB family protein [Jeotgalicoccus psychrophilus]|uniref:CvfB family protein n=1 Tax=Jeotgalicoccus psychrophilus TaxID=157228 RepID=UPI00040E0EA8|nr:S1-like domain-containing RNA-binding protein [Jeotgalicoccus psychrophilus]
MTKLSGTTQFLKVIKKEGSTYTLVTDDNKYIRMNSSEIEGDKEYEIDEEILVFIYPNRSGELFATPTIPSITADKFGYAEVSEVNRDGAYLEIGSPREILIPWIDLPRMKEVWPQVGDMVYATIRVEADDQMFGRLINETEADEKFQPLQKEDYETLGNKWLKGRPYRLLRVGTFILSEEGYKVFVHETEREQEPRLGQEVSFRVIGINEKGEVNASFLEKAYKRLGTDGERIVEYMQMHGDMMEFTDKSSPEDIKATFNLSKGQFKRALGGLLKEGKIVFENGATHLKK